MAESTSQNNISNYSSTALQQQIALDHSYHKAWNAGELENGDRPYNDSFLTQQATSLDQMPRGMISEGGISSMFAPLNVSLPGQGASQPQLQYHQQHQQPSDAPQTFTVTVAAQSKNSRNLDFITGNTAEGFTLYCKADIAVPFIFRYPSGHTATSMRISAVFADERDQNRPVERCPNHRFKDESVFRNHFIRTDVSPPTADYRDASEGYSIILPVQTSVGLTFACYSSCASISRKSIRLMFTLLAGSGQSIEEASMILKVCANPHRDGCKDTPFGSRKRTSALPGLDYPPGVKRDEQFFKKPIPPNHRINHSLSENVVFTVEIRGADMYRRVMNMLAEAEKPARYDAHRLEKCGIAPSLYRDISSIAGESPVYQWLQLPGIGLGSFAETFHRRGMYTMANLAEQYHMELFAAFGFNEDACSKLNHLYLNWYNVYKNGQCLSTS